MLKVKEAAIRWCFSKLNLRNLSFSVKYIFLKVIIMQLICYPMTSILMECKKYRRNILSICYRFIKFLFWIRRSPIHTKVFTLFKVDLDKMMKWRKDVIESKINGKPCTCFEKQYWLIKKHWNWKLLNFKLGTLFKYYNIKVCKWGRRCDQDHLLYQWPFLILWRCENLITLKLFQFNWKFNNIKNGKETRTISC